MTLEKINSPADLKKLPPEELITLAAEIREFLVKTVQETGGHLSSNLGVVELTIALHRVFDFKKDALILDVSHQSYVHKLLTGRRNDFKNLRQLGGISGFTDPEESPYDAFKIGHAGTSISIGLGLQTGFETLANSNKAVVIIGDASISNGAAFEALNHLGHIGKDMLIILNDNQFSISKTVGAFSKYLGKFISGSFYNLLKYDLEHAVNKIPVIGSNLNDILRNFRKSIKKNLIHNIFEEMNVNYIGPLDGHDIPKMIDTFENVVKYGKGPVLLHLLTQKGRGFKDAEDNPTHYHGISTKSRVRQVSFTEVFGSTMLEIAAKHKKVAVITAAMTEGTGLTEFSLKFPERYYDVGIAEEHAVAFAGGLSKSGLKPYVAIYSTFMQRSVDQLFQEISLQKGLSPVFVMDRSGLVGEDGPTHHGVFDIAFTRIFPDFVLMSPKDGNELKNMLEFTTGLLKPAVIRFPKGGFEDFLENSPEISLGKSEVLLEEKNAKFTVFAYGSLSLEALKLKSILKQKFNLVNLRFAKPLDIDTILRFAEQNHPIITIEEHSIIGGIGEAIVSLLNEHRLTNPVRKIGLQDGYYPHGKRNVLLEYAGLTAEKLAETIKEFLK